MGHYKQQAIITEAMKVLESGQNTVECLYCGTKMFPTSEHCHECGYNQTEWESEYNDYLDSDMFADSEMAGGREG